LAEEGVPVFSGALGATLSRQFAVETARYGGGQAASKSLRTAGSLACGNGLPIAPVAGDLSRLRLCTPELCGWGMTATDAPSVGQTHPTWTFKALCI